MYKNFNLLGKISQIFNIQKQLLSPTISNFRLQEPISTVRQLSTSISLPSIWSTGSKVGQITNLLKPHSKCIIPSSYERLDDSPVTQTRFEQFVPARGMKVKGRLKRRCKDCYLIWIDGLLHNLCRTYGRHKQRHKPKYWKNLRILTHATQSPRRPW